MTITNYLETKKAEGKAKVRLWYINLGCCYSDTRRYAASKQAAKEWAYAHEFTDVGGYIVVPTGGESLDKILNNNLELMFGKIIK